MSTRVAGNIAYDGADKARENTQIENMLDAQSEYISSITSKLAQMLNRAGAPVPVNEKPAALCGWVSRVEDHNNGLLTVESMLNQLGQIV